MWVFLTQSINGLVAPAEQAELAIAPVEHAVPAEAGFNIVEVISHHLSDAPLWSLQVMGMDMSITKRVVMMWIAAFLLIAFFTIMARLIVRNRFQRPGRFQGLVEVLINFVRHDVSHAALGHHSRSYDPFFLTMFFFILAGNLLGLIPSLGEIAQTVGELGGWVSGGHGHDTPLLVKLWPGATFTGDIAVTAVLAGISFLVIQLSGFIYQGPAYAKNIVPMGIPAPLWILMWPIEFLGQFTKPFALAVRLLANMTAGHMIIIVFLGFIFQFQSYVIAPISVAGSAAIYMLEIFVAFLQAYVFVFLTALFVAGAQHRH